MFIKRLKRVGLELLAWAVVIIVATPPLALAIWIIERLP